MNFTFDGDMPRDVMESYLSRAATAAGLIDSQTLEDDLRVIRKLGIKFLGRASGIWYMLESDEVHFAKSRMLAERVHAQDPEIILQACVFEIVTRAMNEVPIPHDVFEAFGKPAEQRNFDFDLAVMPGFVDEREGRGPGKSGGMPDLDRDEARMWFYYRATRYIDCGYEALHMGQVHLYTAHDKGMPKTYALFQMIRDYARMHARRHKVLLDAHSHGISVRGKLLLDYHAMPFTRFALPAEPGRQLVLVREGFSEGGENPNGFSGDVMPYLMELDNWGGRVVEHPETMSREELAGRDWWGFDQIGWFANQSHEERNHFIEYAYRWTQVNNIHAYFEIPLRRMLSDARVRMRRADNGEMDVQENYQLNNPSPDCPMGFGQEDIAAACWADGNRLRETYGNPPHLIRYGARDIYDDETGMKLPEKVVVYGSFQPYVGAGLNDSNSEITRMYHVDGRLYTLTVVLPFPGRFDYGISTYGTLSAVYTHDTYPRSGSGPRAYFETTKPNAVVRFQYRFIENVVTLEICE